MKRFKAYDVEFAHLAGTMLKVITARNGAIAREDISSITHWDQNTFGVYETYSREKVEWAVYLSADAVEWQKFRVALKGLSTREKLYCLAYLHKSVIDATPREQLLTRIRINNYLGALIRGGQLSSDGELRVQR